MFNFLIYFFDTTGLNFTMALMDAEFDLEKLIKIDPLRVNYYNDLSMFFQVFTVIHNILYYLESKSSSRQAVSKAKDQTTTRVDMSGLQLYSVRYLNELSHVTHLDLSHNRLIRLGQTFAPLVNVEILILDSNRISQFDDKLILPRLTVLDLANNSKSFVNILFF